MSPSRTYLRSRLRERDRIKKALIEAAPDLAFLEVLEDEPFTDVAYLRGRLVALGVLEVKPGGIWCGDKLGQEATEQEG